MLGIIFPSFFFTLSLILIQRLKFVLQPGHLNPALGFFYHQRGPDVGRKRQKFICIEYDGKLLTEIVFPNILCTNSSRWHLSSRQNDEYSWYNLMKSLWYNVYMSLLLQLFFRCERARRYVSSLQKTMLLALLKGAVMLVGQQFISISFLTGFRGSFACGAPL